LCRKWGRNKSLPAETTPKNRLGIDLSSFSVYFSFLLFFFDVVRSFQNRRGFQKGPIAEKKVKSKMPPRVQ